MEKPGGLVVIVPVTGARRRSVDDGGRGAVNRQKGSSKHPKTVC